MKSSKIYPFSYIWWILDLKLPIITQIELFMNGEMRPNSILKNGLIRKYVLKFLSELYQNWTK